MKLTILARTLVVLPFTCKLTIHRICFPGAVFLAVGIIARRAHSTVFVRIYPCSLGLIVLIPPGGCNPAGWIIRYPVAMLFAIKVIPFRLHRSIFLIVDPMPRVSVSGAWT